MSLGSDLHSAFRTIFRNPGFSAVAIATLALGIGASTAIYSVVDGVLIRPLGYGDESRLVAIHEVMPRFSRLAPRIPVNAMHFFAWPFPDYLVTPAGLAPIVEFKDESIRRVESDRQRDDEAESRDGFFFIHSRSPSLVRVIHWPPSRIIP